MINIAVMGYGTVGSGVVEVINTNGARINQRIGDEGFPGGSGAGENRT